MSRGRRVQAQGDPTTETQATSRAERVAGWLRVPLIVAALLAIPTIIVQESDLGGFWQTLAVVLDWSIWAMFAANLAIMLSIVPDRRRWPNAFYTAGAQVQPLNPIRTEPRCCGSSMSCPTRSQSCKKLWAKDQGDRVARLLLADLRPLRRQC